MAYIAPVPCKSCQRPCRTKSGLCRICTNGASDNLPKVQCLSTERLARLVRECVDELNRRKSSIEDAIKSAVGA